MFSTHLNGVLVAVCVGLLASVQGHGRLWDPPSRASMWRLGFKTPKNYNDNELFCGGMAHHWNEMNGKCGICGDPYDGVREHESGGLYATGTIGKYYREGQIITTDIEMTATHLGWFEFRLCVNNDVNKRATHECLNKHLLQLADGSGTRYRIRNRKGHYYIKLRLPAGVTCDQCVFQWKYHTGNTWGVNMVNKCKGLGCSDAQEEFYGCSDVAILAKNAKIPVTQSPKRMTIRNTTRKPMRHTTRIPHRSTPGHHQRRSTASRSHNKLCRAIGVWTGNSIQNKWCQTNCRLGNCPSSMCQCD